MIWWQPIGFLSLLWLLIATVTPLSLFSFVSSMTWISSKGNFSLNLENGNEKYQLSGIWINQ